jgi:hypothetical protein
MSARRSLEIGMGVVGVASLWGTVARAQLVAPPAASEYQLANGAAAPQVVVRLAPVEGAADIKARVARALLGDKPRPTGQPGFTADYLDKELHLDIQRIPVLDRKGGSERQVYLRAGTYKVVVDLTGTVAVAAQDKEAGAAKGKKRVPRTLSVELQIVLRPAKLTAIPSIKVVHDRFPWPFETHPSRIVTLTEESEVTNLTRLRIHPSEQATSGDWQVEAGFNANAPDELGAGESVAVMLEGHDFPLGTTKGQLAIEADQLEQPAMIPFEVKARVYSGFIILVFLGGGLCGWAVRHRLRNTEARAVIEAQLAPLLQKADAEEDINDDVSKQSAIEQARNEVTEALEGTDQVALQTKVNALGDTIKSAAEARMQIVNGLFKVTDSLKKTLTTAWDMPEETADPIAAAVRDVALAERGLVRQDTKAAAAALTSARNQIDLAGATVNAWLERAHTSTRRLSNPDTTMPAPAAVRVEANALVTLVIQKLAAAGLYDQTRNRGFAELASALEPFLRAAHEARSELRRLVGTVVPAFAVEAHAAMDALKTAGKTEAEMAALSATIPIKSDTDPADAVRIVGDAMTAFVSALRPLLQGAEATTQLESGNFVKAVNLSLGGGTNISAIANERRVLLAGQPLAAPREPQRPAGDALVAPQPPALDPIILAESHLAKVRVVRGIVVASIMAVAAWAIYRDSWIGTLGDVFGMGVVAFFTDFTVDAVVDALGKVKKPA